MNKIKEPIREVEALVEEINTILGKSLTWDCSDADRTIIRRVRDKNIETYLEIQRLDMRGLLE